MKQCLYMMCAVALITGGCKEAEIERVKLAELNGDPVDLRSMKGKTVFINFWATWCGPCIQEMPTIHEAQQSLKVQNVVFLIASNEDTDEIQGFAKRKPFDFHYVRILNLEQLKISTLPTTYIFDPDGNLKFSESGSRNWNETENLKLITQ